jgi:CheY-like chemotaxis protein
MRKILLVEDDANTINLIAILLEREGYAVVQATSAEEGIPLALAGPPDLILMDVALPGLKATRVLKEAGSTARVPEIALTARARKEDETKALRAGCDGFISKPLSTRAFLDQVAGFLGEQGQGGEG